MVEESKGADPVAFGWTRLAESAPATLAEASGAHLLPEGNVLRLKVLGRDHDIDLSAREIRASGEDSGELDRHLRILILHYVAGAGNAPVADRLATFREFEAGDLYYSVFKSRAIDVVIRTFGTNPQRLKHAGESLGADHVKMGNVGFKVRFFPKLPMVVALWLGDEEVPPSANILFDASAGRILPTEDLAIAGEILVDRLREISGDR